MPEELADFPALAHIVGSLQDRIGEAIAETSFERRELSVKVRTANLLAILEFLRSGLGFNALNDMIGLDHPPRAGETGKRFSVLYQLYKFPGGLRVRVVIDVDEGEPVPSVTSIYRSADWAEREIFDMFGIRFSGHPGLRRIYLPDDFEGHPLRKDFPLGG
jgi:NADH-quinone oxidoreductase subunit C